MQGGAAWPGDYYDGCPEDWRPFGPQEPTAKRLILDVFKKINGQRRAGSRLARLLKEYRLEPRWYALADYLTDDAGSRALIEEVRDRGCLFLVDEVALLHPALRKDIGKLLNGQSSAVVCTSPLDPLHRSTKVLLGDFSHFNVGSLRERFRDHLDPRCELSLNSPARLERWLCLALPELIMTLGQAESQPELVGKVPEYLR
jgi:hypothetical protein